MNLENKARQQRDKVRELNLQINARLTSAGVLDSKGKLIKLLTDFPPSEWKNWITELIIYRNKLDAQIS